MNQLCKGDIWIHNDSKQKVIINWLTPPQPAGCGYTLDWSVTFSSNSPNIHDMSTMERTKFLINYTFLEI
jgi:hypothetical protein